MSLYTSLIIRCPSSPIDGSIVITDVIDVKNRGLTDTNIQGTLVQPVGLYR